MVGLFGRARFIATLHERYRADASQHPHGSTRRFITPLGAAGPGRWRGYPRLRESNQSLQRSWRANFIGWRSVFWRPKSVRRDAARERR
ncbi:hypothetical protein KCP69_03305 [Salmonella enterica subsp. enterica]|nr:hypothetical protein KCP69_03305 [Salmonella enterica subsp. enterica]